MLSKKIIQDQVELQDKIEVVMGIDPGVTGAVALIDMHGKYVCGYKFEHPTPEDMANIISTLNIMFAIHFTGIEKIVHRPNQDVNSTATFATNIGVIKGVLAANFIEYIEVEPKIWKGLSEDLRKQPDDSKHFAKKRSLEYAQERWPEANLSKVADIDIADALCIAEHTRILNSTPAAKAVQDKKLKMKEVKDTRSDREKHEEEKAALLEKARKDWRKPKKQ